ncbi:restriction endonuclease subunit S [Xanthomonas campestris pv. campestris]|uniref:restriction endonuclease subunit S n=1 Tax=Xanthomonas campestris TaxID=339 RepID=UPI0009D6637D|nr:restriction endonuclease subunit S [Xanthomonas campestris]MDO0790213.1 restriction endonuclease subunit S [Xanthomonas campestris pv. campestris]MDO0838585.1 restriction endonuclease subunit S [Xanthomonas campestris pv. campestris]MEA0699017.1 restriction endonuclease subunit S [Xanthomonas campestris pv. campestris]MEA0777858.1 restriction endonuclease subunit S [Xanthomonas campestris pv. campestris]MEA0785968.1 restriction endonuclease subunit S [Xanthomonas campestris pv. campestris]
MLPKGWTQNALRENIRIHSGHAPGNLDLLSKGEIPYVKVEDLNNCDKYQSHSREYLESCRSVVPARSLIFPKRGAAIFANKIRIAARPIALDTNLMAVEVVKGLDAEYLYYAISFAGLHQLADTSTIPQLNNKHVLPYVLPRPSLQEQRRIAHILSTWDQAIATTERLLANTRNCVEILSNALLTGRKRFDGHAAWQSKPLSEMICESRVVGSGGDVAKKITVKLYGKGVVGKSDKRAGSESTQYYRRSSGQFIYSKLDFLNGAFGRIPASLDGYESTLDLPAFDFLEGIDPRWFLQYVSREAFYTGHLGLANGGRKARRVNPKDLLRICVPTPCLKEQTRIADAIEAALSAVSIQERHLTLIRQEKSALMSQLLTGKRRVRLPADEAAHA